ncbi:hypothetical protein BKA57DRAFT_475824, partial [Linnemannia elongata]
MLLLLLKVLEGTLDMCCIGIVPYFAEVELGQVALVQEGLALLCRVSRVGDGRQIPPSRDSRVDEISDGLEFCPLDIMSLLLLLLRLIVILWVLGGRGGSVVLILLRCAQFLLTKTLRKPRGERWQCRPLTAIAAATNLLVRCLAAVIVLVTFVRVIVIVVASRVVVVVRGQVCVANLLKESGGEAQGICHLGRAVCWMDTSSVLLAVSRHRGYEVAG